MSDFIIFYEIMVQTKLINIDPPVKRKLISWCAYLYAQWQHASGSWLRNKQVANMQGYNTIL